MNKRADSIAEQVFPPLLERNCYTLIVGGYCALSLYWFRLTV